jgi:hypothetical protein
VWRRGTQKPASARWCGASAAKALRMSPCTDAMRSSSSRPKSSAASRANERRRAYRRDAGLALPRHRYLTGARPDAGARRRSVTGWLLDTEPRRPKPELKVLAFITAHPLIRGCARPLVLLNMRAIRFCRMRCYLFFMECVMKDSPLLAGHHCPERCRPAGYLPQPCVHCGE